MSPTPYAATALQAIYVARTYLNDESRASWSDATLLPMLKTAHQELSAKLVANGMSVTRNQSAIISVPALIPPATGPIVLPSTPANLLEPISMLERDAGDDVEDFVLMQQVDFIPDLDPVDELIYWAFIGQKIMLLGATNDNEVQLRYQGSLPFITDLTSSLTFSFAENYLGPRVAALAYMSVGDGRWKSFYDQAMNNLDMVVKYNVVGEQGIPKRRMGYRRGAFRRIY
jgi:hypothetical protein